MAASGEASIGTLDGAGCAHGGPRARCARAVRDARDSTRAALRATVALLLPLALAACNHAGNASVDTIRFADPELPSTATAVDVPRPEETLSLVLGLERDDAGLARRVRDMSTPGSPHYRERRTVAEIAAEFGATDDTIDAIVGDLRSRGINTKPDVTRGFVAAQVTIAQASELFGTSFTTYEIDGVGRFVAPTTDPSAPPSWQGIVREVLGLSTLPVMRDTPSNSGATTITDADGGAATTTASDGADSDADAATARPAFTVVDQPGVPGASGTPQGCDEALRKIGFKPNQLLTAYGIAPLRDAGFAGQGIRMALVENVGFAQSDIDTFTACFGIENPVTPTVVLTGSLAEPLPVGPEATLDIEVTLAVAPQLEGLYVFEVSGPSLADAVQLYAAPLDRNQTGGAPISVLSSSLGVCELSITSGYVALMEHLLATAAAANVSVFASAGDSGSSTCYHHDGVTQTLSASYPATSAYATAVGGTNLALDATNAIVGSSVWNDLPWSGKDSAGGGGPSVLIEAPLWQTGTQTGERMRTTPDVAFFGDPLPGYTIYNSSNGGWYDDGGTSAATPFLAASTALLHQALLARERATPVVAYEWIYGIATSSDTSPFYDIVLGDNDLFGVGCCTAGPGYDQASGWGSMNVAAVLDVLATSPQYHVAP